METQENDNGITPDNQKPGGINDKTSDEGAYDNYIASLDCIAEGFAIHVEQPRETLGWFQAKSIEADEIAREVKIRKIGLNKNDLPDRPSQDKVSKEINDSLALADNFSELNHRYDEIAKALEEGEQDFQKTQIALGISGGAFFLGMLLCSDGGAFIALCIPAIIVIPLFFFIKGLL